ncbi:Chondroitin synthase [compost metagenome]|jgi:GT2 family glycosyltransferase|uniref:glycosyltransferase family 2 protein n=1 Tax=Paenibacillus TaxID=44249 RepID=UPI000FA78C17|nr:MULTISPECIES: glycosyltransferase family 2 protein [Paenibacillus]MUG86571.1 glycosyltransferase [Paenibacillus timonensis]GIP49457.1 glycosyl transferase [Paenibacillus sp. J53TS2]
MSGTGVTSIIIPTYNGLHLLAPCVEAIRQYTETPYEIIVVDNGSEDDTASFCLKERLILAALPRNEGFPVAVNRGLSVASGDQLLILNNDVAVSPRWLSNLLLALHSAPDVGLVGPVTNYASGRQQVAIDWVEGEDFAQAAEKHNRSDSSKWQEVQRLVGMCLLFKREVLERAGLFDEGYSPGHYEDDDYCYRARQLGYRLLICGDTLVYHEGSSSFKAQHPEGWNELLERNRMRFIEKWGVDPWQFIS